ncbi:endonuclease/exonuclease/phosphatase family protein [Cellulomonas sp. H30R-01]|uniref:endonuclease/exonuclease/phosphatase family protein n=1 Tax=Cellulomonas sp. H30R-01 TaxID=2704467 RepID=UPI00138D944F|nr:endonuclease/exonuclease/phosphatase family protein [Cellulomonas sp. H30R-01]QHT56041.1 endonuclease/exonuclease/phosphatase family protein [Cellulomonas sp. H30R-01]
MTPARVAGWTLAAVAAVVVVVVLVPVGGGVHGVAQLVSFRAVLGGGALALALLLAAVPWTRRRLLPLVVVLAVGAVGQAGVLAWRSVPLPGTGTTAAAATGPVRGELVVLTFNTLDVVRAPVLADLVDAHDADVVVLPETSASTARDVAARLADRGRPMQVLTAPGDVRTIAGTALLVSPGVGRYTEADALPTRLGSLRADPVGDGPVLVAAHPMAPIQRSAMPTWRAETTLVARTCAQTPGAIVAGDLNATLDHPGLRSLGPCVDAARAAGAGAQGTWPASAPTLLAAPIDHVLVDGRRWRVTSVDVLPATGGSDHRPVVARLVAR